MEPIIDIVLSKAEISKLMDTLPKDSVVLKIEDSDKKDPYKQYYPRAKITYLYQGETRASYISYHRGRKY